MTRLSSEQQRQGGLIGILFLLALALRVLYVPLHLALEEHVGRGGHAHGAQLAVHSAVGGHHDGDHDPSRGHEPHPALDHASDLIVARTRALQGTIDLPFQLPEECRLAAPQARVSAAAELEPRPPAARPLSPRRSRAPPAAG
jgi:hypothetical protein